MDFSQSFDETLPFPVSSSSPMAHFVLTWLRPIAERFLLVSHMQKACHLLPPARADGTIEERMLEALQVSIQINDHDVKAVPPKGPLIVVANHPFGAIDGLALATVLHAVRPDFKIIVNHLLRYVPIPALQNRFIHVNPFGQTNSIRTNIKPLRQAVQWVRSGNALVVFPAGEVSHLQWCKRAVTDPIWSETVARIVRQTGSTVLPVYFEGANSALFQVLGLIHPRLRTLLLPREVFKKRSQSITMRVGRPIGFDKLCRFEHNSKMTQYLRLKTYILGTRKGQRHTPPNGLARGPATPQPAPIAPPVPSRRLTQDINRLTTRHVLVDTARFTVYQAASEEIPNLLPEIGRLREITFRQAGEGTGNDRDLDRFDGHYTHLLLWNKEDEEIVGVYRLGLTGEIIGGLGPAGFYTRTLFDYGREFLDRIHPAIELGRSFVIPEYQKNYQPLMLLWRGIGEFIASRPEYASLFGPVSINNGYHALSREFIVHFCQRIRPSSLASLIAAKHPPKSKRRKEKEMAASCWLLEDVQDLSELISDIEPDQKGIPILLKHYMKLGGEFLGFSTDPHFNDVLDALLLVDLRRTDPKILDRYMGKSNAKAFLQRHQDQAWVSMECA